MSIEIVLINRIQFQQFLHYFAGLYRLLGIVRYCAGLSKLGSPAPVQPVRGPGFDAVYKTMECMISTQPLIIVDNG